MYGCHEGNATPEEPGEESGSQKYFAVSNMSEIILWASEGPATSYALHIGEEAPDDQLR